ncbi:MAG: hypothetical protein AAFQ82_16320, partial [Myxococcota bacterium]
MPRPVAGYHPLVSSVAELLEQRLRLFDGIESLPPPDGLGFVRDSGSHEYRLEEPGMNSWALHFSSRIARKVHLEVTRLGPAFAYVHAMVFPQLDRALPMFGVDVNATPKKVTLAVFHLYPSPGEMLPPGLERIRRRLKESEFAKHRPLPEWGEVFQSGACAIVQPQSPAEETQYLSLVRSFIDGFLRASSATPSRSDLKDQIAERQTHYSRHKRRNTGGSK